MALLIQIIGDSRIEDGKLIIPNVVNNWPLETMEKIPEPLSKTQTRWTMVKNNGVIKSSLMTLGVEHFHNEGDIVVTRHWEALLEGLGYEIYENNIRKSVETESFIRDRVAKINEASDIIYLEDERVGDLEKERDLARIEATTAARQSGLDIEQTENAGNQAAAKIIDHGPDNENSLLNAKILLDENEVERSLWIVRKTSNLRWEDSVPCRIGARMGRPEKSARRELKPLTHSLYPIGENGGSQKLLIQAAKKGRIRVEMSRRICQDCGKESPNLICHNRELEGNPIECGGKTVERKTRGSSSRRRRGERTTVDLDKLLEVKRRSLGLDRLPALIKAQKELLSEAQTPEPIEKGILRAKHGVSVFRDGTSRYDMIDVPVTHFKPKEIYTSWEKLYQLGYEKDVFGQELNSDEQILELFPQDIIPSLNAEEHLISTCNFVDDLLVRFYKMEPFYNVKTIGDIVGSLAIGLAPHTSGGVLCRIIGWTAASAGYAHPLFHAAKRRNCDGDEDSILMLMDGLLNFSKHILPSGRGGRMDAPLVLTTRLNPSEIDKEALNVDCSYYYTRSFYEKTQRQPHPSELSDEVETVETRLGTIGDLRGYGWTHESGELDAGPKNSSYKTLKSMEDKMNGQLSIGSLLRSVRVEKVASQVIESHFLPDLRGNLVAFTRQKVRCVKCGEKYRRMPLAGKCIQSHKLEIGGLSARRGEDSTMCGGNVILTVTEGAVRKYIKVTEGIIENYGVGMYTEQRVKWLTESADSLFNNDKVTVMTLSDFL
jgi:DNA polymerase II large subunit